MGKVDFFQCCIYLPKIGANPVIECLRVVGHKVYCLRLARYFSENQIVAKRTERFRLNINQKKIN
jgi:hypothetical protein